MKRNKYIPTMKNLFALFLMFAASCLSAQNLINPQLPNVIPPSPTASALMKFEEVPISYYTGLPSIEIPIFSSKMQNGKDMEVKLSYHPASGKNIEIASDCGLGWSLNAGGSISRTVKGYPDEILIRDGGRVGKVGIYQTDAINHSNQYYAVTSMINSGNYDYESPLVNEYFWDVNVRGKYDSEHDMYQYNFLGYTGRFIIKKNNGTLEVNKLDINPLKITNNYNPSTFVPNSFKIIDDSGNQYIFDVVEISKNSQTTSSMPRSIDSNYPLSTDNEYEYRSSFHLSKIYDINNILLAQIDYSAVESLEKSKFSSTTQYVDKYNVIPQYASYFGENGDATFNPLPSSTTTTNNTQTLAKKIESITIPGKEKISFTFSRGRQDINLVDPANSYKLSEITVKDRLQAVSKKMVFQHTYSGELGQRMLLTQIKEYGSGTSYLSRDLSYKPLLAGAKVDNVDPPFGMSDPASNFGVTTAFLLSKMTLPTGGHIEYNFGPSTYSYIGNVPIPAENFESNLKNWLFITNWVPYDRDELGISHKKFLFQIDTRQKVKFATSNYFSPNITDFAYTIYKKRILPNGTFAYDHIELSVGAYYQEGVPSSQNAFNEGILDPGEYYASLSVGNGQVAGQPFFLRGSLGVYFKRWRKFNDDGSRYYPAKFWDGDDARINSISYFDGTNTKTDHFDYGLFSDPGRSSGSIAYPFPVFNSITLKKECVTINNGTIQIDSFDIIYDAITSTNQLSVVKTKGADIGYQNVSIYKINDPKNMYGINDGRLFKQKALTYTSPIDYPEEITIDNTSYPFFPTLNIDYKRGLLVNESSYNAFNEKIQNIEYKYSFEDHVAATGLRLVNIGNRAFFNFRNHSTYAVYNSFLESCNTRCYCTSGRPTSFLNYSILKEAYGWAKLDEVITRDYSVFGVNNYSETKTKYQYKSFNQKVWQQVQEFNDGNTIRTDFLYAGDDSGYNELHAGDLFNRNSISTLLKTENYRNDEKIAESKIVYKDWGNGLLKPEIIQQSKGNNLLEDKVKYNQVDIKGNPLEVQQTAGSKICYIWGYDKTLPVAKIENSVAYTSINPSIIAAIENASGALNYSEANLINALKSLRSETNLQKSMITTFTYTPSSTISTITDPKGDVVKYTYDTFGNLEFIRDKEGNILSESKYHYQNQF